MKSETKKVEIRVIRERVDENGNPEMNPYTGRPKINGGAILLPDLSKLFPGEKKAVDIDVAVGLLRDVPQMVMLEHDHQARLATIEKNRARHQRQNRDDIRQAMQGSERDRAARARMEQLIREKDAREAEQRAALTKSKEATATEQAKASDLEKRMQEMMAKLEERERKDAETAARLAAVQAELDEAKAKLSNPDKPKPEPEKPAEPKTDKGSKKA